MHKLFRESAGEAKVTKRELTLLFKELFEIFNKDLFRIMSFIPRQIN